MIMKQLTKKSLLLIPITLCGLALGGCGKSSQDDVGSVHTDVTKANHHKSSDTSDSESHKHKSDKDTASHKSVEEDKKNKDKRDGSSSKKNHKKGDKSEDSSSAKDSNKQLKNETKEEQKTSTNNNGSANNNQDNDVQNNNNNAAGQNNNNGNNQVYTAAQDNQKFMNTKPDKVLPPVNTSTPQQPSNTGDLQGKVTYKETNTGQAQQDNRKVNVSGNTASYDGQSISADDFNTAKKYFESKKLDEPDYIYFEWAKYAKDHKCSLDDAYKQNVNMVN